MQLNIFILFLATFFTGIMTGLFFTWSFSVTKGLARLSDDNYVKAFQSLNKAILNPAFGAVFWGAPLSLIISTILYYQQPLPGIFWHLLISAIVYLVGCIVITFAGNIPLNNSLEKFDLKASSSDDIKQKRAGFEGRWNRLNMIRTISSSIAFIVLIIACLKIA